MRSLWRKMAARWIGGEASESLTGDTGLFDVIMQNGAEFESTFLVRRQSGVSHQAMMSQQTDVKTPIGDLANTDREA